MRTSSELLAHNHQAVKERLISEAGWVSLQRPLLVTAGLTTTHGSEPSEVSGFTNASPSTTPAILHYEGVGMTPTP